MSYSSGHDFRDAPVNSKATIVINNDGGGIVDDFKNKVHRYASEGRQIKVAGSCRSACTLVLAYTNTCVYRSAIFKWHIAYNPNNRSDLNYAVTEEMIDWMPWSIQDRLRKYVAQDYNSGATMTGSDLISRGIRECR